jgi:hypothetical protein
MNLYADETLQLLEFQNKRKIHQSRENETCKFNIIDSSLDDTRSRYNEASFEDFL